MSNQRIDYSKVERLFRSGKVMHQIAKEMGLSCEGVRLILLRRGVPASEGGASKQAQMRRQRAAEAKDKRYIEKYGCTYQQFKSVCGHHSQGAKSPFRAFTYQRNTAVDRGIEWRLSFWDWWAIWDASGQWCNRGRGVNGYCMSRIGDTGAYEIGNVYIGKVSSNSRDGRVKAWEKPAQTAFYRVIRAAGGRKRVANALGISPGYLSWLAAIGTMPAVWMEDGKAEALAGQTQGAYSVSDLAAFVVRGKREEAA